MQRADDFATRRKHLAELSEAELEKRFWELSDKIMQPLVDLAAKHTSPSIERSVLLRMGFASVEAGAIVKRIHELGLLGKGAGQVVVTMAKLHQCSVNEAGEKILTAAGGEQVVEHFRGGVR
ncbi:MAG: D-ornithine 4,5-aminomutase subunit alpha [Firmicutes bacterium]|nr:D-ornithine 4,5-aminomutase subunit alpha [Bacillota bacterium]MBT9157578.1 D-ornithine 4,5-aminomutase subunit alpha [Bacillota bacterium]